MGEFLESLKAMREFAPVKECGCFDSLVNWGLKTELNGMSVEEAMSAVRLDGASLCHCGNSAPVMFIENAVINNYCICQCGSGSTSGNTSGETSGSTEDKTNVTIIAGTKPAQKDDNGDYFSEMELKLDTPAGSDVKVRVEYQYIEGLEIKTGTTEVTVNKNTDTASIILTDGVTDSKIILAEVIEQASNDKKEYNKYEAEKPDGQCYVFMARRNKLNKIVYEQTGDIDELVVNSAYIKENAQSAVLSESGSTSVMKFTIDADYVSGYDDADDPFAFIIENGYDYGLCFAVDTTVTDFMILDAMEAKVDYFLIDSAVNIPRVDSNGNTVNEFYNIYVSYDDVSAQYSNVFDTNVTDADPVEFEFKIIRKNN